MIVADDPRLLLAARPGFLGALRLAHNIHVMGITTPTTSAQVTLQLMELYAFSVVFSLDTR